MGEDLSRRDFLERAALVPLGAGVGVGLGGAAAVAQTPIKRAGGAKLELSLNAYSFSKALTDHIKGRGKGMTLFDLLDYCAEQDFDAIDPTGYFFPGYPKVPGDKYLNDFKRRAFVLGLDLSGTGVRNDFASADRDRRAADVRHVKGWIECAARMGAPVLRVFAGAEPTGHPRARVVEWMVEELKKCVEHGKKYGVLVGIQNHGDMLETADQVLEVVTKVDSEWFGVVDTGYFLRAGAAICDLAYLDRDKAQVCLPWRADGAGDGSSPPGSGPRWSGGGTRSRVPRLGIGSRSQET